VTGPGFTPGFVDPVMKPADVEWMAVYYLTPLMYPTPVATRLPNPKDNKDTIDGFLRVERGGGHKCNYFEYDQTIILHAYSPDEPQAADIIATATAWMSAARGQKISGRSVTGVPHATDGHKLSDPNVINLTRYRSLVTWRVPGHLVVPPGS
jgi:hypothetical protein